MIIKSPLVALHEACCAVRSGDAKSAIVVASSVMLGSKDDAEKYEVSAVYIKTLPDAIRDGHPIRAVVRASTAASVVAAFDEDSAAKVFEKLIRNAYVAAGLEPRSTLLVQVSKHISSQI